MVAEFLADLFGLLRFHIEQVVGGEAGFQRRGAGREFRLAMALKTALTQPQAGAAGACEPQNTVR